MKSEKTYIKELEDVVREFTKPKRTATKRKKDKTVRLFHIAETLHYYITGTDDDLEHWREDGYGVNPNWEFSSVDIDHQELTTLNEDGTHKFELIEVGGSL